MTTDYAAFVASRAKHLPTREERLEHAYMGVLGELGEIIDAWKKHRIYEQMLDTANILEELGDLRFYIQMVINEIPDYVSAPKGSERQFKSVLSACLNVARDLNNMNELKWSDLAGAQWLERHFWWLCKRFGFDPQAVIDANVAKLEKRYPTGYSNELAAARLDKVEG